MQLSGLDIEIIGLVKQHALPAVMGIARIGACFAWLPYLSTGTISSKMLRAIIALAVLIGLWPVTRYAVIPGDMLGMGFALGLEVLAGTSMGLLLSMPFHAFHALGAIIDNQRGASISSTLDPLSGIEATETANLLQMFSVVVFLMSGGLLHVLEVVEASYALVPMGTRWVPQPDAAHAFMALLLSAAVRMAMPVLLLLLLVEVLLGVLSRFAQQMNAFSVSLAVKSFLAFLAMLVYVMPMVVEQLPLLQSLHDGLDLLDPVRSHED